MKKLVLLTVLLALPQALWAAAEPTTGTIELRSEAEVEISEDQVDGTRITRRVPATQVVPGDEVIFTLHYRNYGTEPAEDVFITNPIPGHMELRRAGALPAGSAVTYSIDGGRSFGDLAELRIAAGDGGERPAAASDCTHIRWTFDEPLQPGATGAVDYTALLQ